MMRWWRRSAGLPAVATLVLALAGAPVLLGPALWAGAARAATEPRNLFEVRAVRVDVSAATATQAREQALADAEIRAFQRLLDRLTLPRDQATTKRFTTAEIASATKDFWVSEEKVSPVRYIATLNYEFRAERVRELAAAKGIPLVTAVAQPVLIVPVLDGPGGARLWPPDNPWWDAFAGLVADGLVPMVMPRADAEDASLIDARAALAMDESRLATLARRHDALDIAVAVARPQGVGGGPSAPTAPGAGREPAGDFQVAVVIRRKLAFGPASETRASVRAEPGESASDLFKRAASVTAQELENGWKEAQRSGGGAAGGVIAVDVPVRDIKTWLLVEKSLNRIPGVRRVEPVMFSPGRVRVNVFFTGTNEQIASALEGAGFAVTPAGEFWIVRPVKVLSSGPS